MRQDKTSTLSISAITISFNCWSLLDKCLESIERSSVPCEEIIVIDNASVDGSQEKVREKYSGVTLIENTENVGHTRAVNQGCREASGGLILLLDADTELRPDTIEIMAAYLRANPDAWIVGPKTYLGDGSVQDSAKNFPRPINGLFGRQSLLSRCFPHNPFTRRYLRIRDLPPGANGALRVEHVSAACMLFRRDVLDMVGPWDEGFHSYWVDADWCMRVLRAGGGIYYLPTAEIVHYEQNQRRLKKSPVRIIKFHTGAYRFYRKHYTRGVGDPRALLAGMLLTLRAAALLVGNHFKDAPATGKDPLSIK